MNATNRSNAHRLTRIHGQRIARIHACIDNVTTALAWAGLASGAIVMLAMVAHGLVQA